jgi:hypothetical protein
MNQTPILLSGSVSLKALALREPIRLRVNIPDGVCVFGAMTWGGAGEGVCVGGGML